MKFGQLIESNMKNIFVEKLYTECGGVYFSTICLWINSQVEDYSNILKLNCRPLAFTS